MSKKLLFINPQNESGYFYSGVTIPPLAFAYLAAVTPDNWHIELIDEDVENFSFKDADLVGITTLTVTANRAYQIAKMYRDKGIPVILGGIHASLVPHEALRFCDTVVIGEAESVWPKVIKDFENGQLKETYKGEFLPLEKLPRPQRDIFKGKKYLLEASETSRGCPMNCDFCSTTVFHGNRFRMRPVGEILDELASFDQRYVFFVDDNLIGYGKAARQRALDLFKGMVERKLDYKKVIENTCIKEAQ